MNYHDLTIIILLIGFITNVLTHVYHINIHSKKIKKIEKDVSNILNTVSNITSVVDPAVTPAVNEINTFFDDASQEINKSSPVG
jgi:peptidoglycan hydrolase CwlO-like protein